MWAESKQQPGQFTGSTGARVLSAAELASGYQAWVKKVGSFTVRIFWRFDRLFLKSPGPAFVGRGSVSGLVSSVSCTFVVAEGRETLCTTLVWS
jgi:hypothetical protein